MEEQGSIGTKKMNTHTLALGYIVPYNIYLSLYKPPLYRLRLDPGQCNISLNITQLFRLVVMLLRYSHLHKAQSPLPWAVTVCNPNCGTASKRLSRTLGFRLTSSGGRRSAFILWLAWQIQKLFHRILVCRLLSSFWHQSVAEVAAGDPDAEWMFDSLADPSWNTWNVSFAEGQVFLALFHNHLLVIWISWHSPPSTTKIQATLYEAEVSWTLRFLPLNQMHSTSLVNTMWRFIQNNHGRHLCSPK